MSSTSTPALAPPPRPLPVTLTVRVALGGVWTQMGWIILLFSVLFVWIFDPGGALVSAARFAGELAEAEGVVSGWGETSLRINERPVYEVRYDFTVVDQPYTGVSYQTGAHPEEGDPATIEYLAADPSMSRIRGMRPTPAGMLVSFVVLFPLVGLGLALWGMRRGLRARHLMATGRLAHGKLKAKEPTGTVVNNQRVYRLTFDFPAAGGGSYEVVGRTHRTYDLEDEPEERLVYDPRNPTDAALLDELPCRPSIDGRGHFVLDDPRQYVFAALNLVAPILATLAYGAYVLLG